MTATTKPRTSKKLAGQINSEEVKSEVNTENSLEPQKELTKKEKRLLRRRFKTSPDEREALVSNLNFICEQSIAWYNVEEDGRSSDAVTVRIYQFRGDRFKEEHLNNFSFLVYCGHDGRFWRVKNFKKLSILIDALKKDVRNRYTYLDFTK